MPDNNRNFTPTPKNFFDEYKLQLFGEKLPNGKSSPTFKIRVVNGNPRIDVWTNDPTDRDKGKIQAGMDVWAFTDLLVGLEKLYKGEIDGGKIKNSNYTWHNRQQSETPKHLTTTIFAKEESGRFYIALVAKDRPMIKFYFKSNNFHTLCDLSGEPLTETEDSRRRLESYCRIMHKVLDRAMSDWIDRSKKKDNNSGNGYGNNNRGGGEYKTSPKGRHGGFDDFDDDIAF